MSKVVTKRLKLVIEGGKANPAPPVGPALGAAGVNIMDFCKQFNDKTKAVQGPVPVKIDVYNDKTFKFRTTLAPMSHLIKKEIGIEKGSTTPGLTIVKKMTKAQIKSVAEQKLPDLNTDNINQAMKIVAGQALSMGIEVEDLN
ncbi:MAG TPA: 50S ribosomal protein L11 [Alphaproteobacteria bacterium]|nr:50S ribosomal protein L11 [Alphaproteobacteria bacterium]